MSKDEILQVLDKCFGITDSDDMTRWCKCVLLCDWLLMHDRTPNREDNYVNRICYCRFITGFSVLQNDKIIDKEVKDTILCGFQAREYLSLTRTTKKDIGVSESILLSYLEEITSDNLQERIRDLDSVYMSRKEYRKRLHASLEIGQNGENEGIISDS